MSWAVGYDTRWGRDIGYGVPALCDQPDCGETIDRGLGYVCGGEPYGGEHGCGLFFCDTHLYGGGPATQQCDRCVAGPSPEWPGSPSEMRPYKPTADVPGWLRHKLTDQSWELWRVEHPDQVTAIRRSLEASDA